MKKVLLEELDYKTLDEVTMTVKNKYEAIVTGISNKVADKMQNTLKLPITVNWKPVFYIINNPPPQEQDQFEKVTDEDAFVEKVADRVVAKLENQIAYLISQPQQEIQKVILQASTVTATAVVTGQLTFAGEAKGEVREKRENDETASPTTVSRSDSPAKKPRGPDEGANF